MQKNTTVAPIQPPPSDMFWNSLALRSRSTRRVGHAMLSYERGTKIFERPLHAMGHLAKGFGVILDHVGFEVIHNRSDVSFLTSDNPVVCFDPTVPEASVLPYQVRPPLGSIELLFPIDAETVLRGRSDLRRPGALKLGHVALTARQEVKRLNRFVARFGYRLFSRVIERMTR